VLLQRTTSIVEIVDLNLHAGFSAEGNEFLLYGIP